MYILDTNVVSELMKSDAEPAVRAKIIGIQPNWLFTTAITSAEIFAGIARLPAGRRRYGLQTAAESMFLQIFSGRVLRSTKLPREPTHALPPRVARKAGQ